MSTVRKFLDLSTCNLPEQVMNGPLNSFEGVIAYEDEYGAWMWVPPASDDCMGIDARERDHEDLPPEVVTLWRYARSLDCDYVRFDRDAPIDTDLQSWDW